MTENLVKIQNKPALRRQLAYSIFLSKAQVQVHVSAKPKMSKILAQTPPPLDSTCYFSQVLNNLEDNQ